MAWTFGHARGWRVLGWVDRLALALAAIVLTQIASSSLGNICDGWRWLPGHDALPCTDLPVQELVRTWVSRAGLLASIAFALGIRAAGLALCGALIGAVIGEPLGGAFFQRPPLGASLGASFGLVVGGFLGVRIWPMKEEGPSLILSLLALGAAVAVVWVAYATAQTVPEIVNPAGSVCREPSIAGLCHKHLIAVLIVVDAFFLAALFVRFAVGHARTSPSRQHDRRRWGIGAAQI